MFKSIQINDFNRYKNNINESQIEEYKEKNKADLKPLEEYLLDGSNTFSAEKIQENLFPNFEKDIFLSHAHYDEKQTIQLACFLEKRGLKVFVDSCLWGNVFDLLKQVDNKYCLNSNSNTYNYQTRNYTTANIYMILNTALHKIIDKSELFLFLKTTRSVKVEDTLTGKNESLNSPWLYSELMFANQVKRIPPSRGIASITGIESLTESLATEAASVKFDYHKPKLDTILSIDVFNNWLENSNNRSGTDLLDLLYASID